MSNCFTTRKPAEGMETLKKPRGKRKSKLQLATKILRSWIMLKNLLNVCNLDMSMIQSNAGQPQREPWSSLQWSKWAWTFHPKSSAWTSSSISNLKRWGTGEPISLSPALQPLLSWDFYPPSGTRCLTSYSPKRRRQQRASEVRPTPVLVIVGLSPPIPAISLFPFLSITGF